MGLDHFEGRSTAGRQHITLVIAAHAFLTERRLPSTAAQQDTHDTEIETELAESYDARVWLWTPPQLPYLYAG